MHVLYFWYIGILLIFGEVQIPNCLFKFLVKEYGKTCVYRLHVLSNFTQVSTSTSTQMNRSLV